MYRDSVYVWDTRPILVSFDGFATRLPHESCIREWKMLPNKSVKCRIPFAQNDPTDPGGAFRPNLSPAKQKGTEFKPLQMERREPTVKDLSLLAMWHFAFRDCAGTSSSVVQLV